MHMSHKLCLCVMLDLIESVMHDNFSLSPFNLHICLNMSIIIFSKRRLHPWFRTWTKVWLYFFIFILFFI
jgi:hypothetical protein